MVCRHQTCVREQKNTGAEWFTSTKDQNVGSWCPCHTRYCLRTMSNCSSACVLRIFPCGPRSYVCHCMHMPGIPRTARTSTLSLSPRFFDPPPCQLSARQLRLCPVSTPHSSDCVLVLSRRYEAVLCEAPLAPPRSLFYLSLTLPGDHRWLYHTLVQM